MDDNRSPRIALFLFVLTLTMLTAWPRSAAAQSVSKPRLAGSLHNNPARQEEFMDWGLGMFVHWSLDSQLGAVISHSMEYASPQYLDRYITQLPRTFNPDQFDPDKWMQLASLAGARYMVFTTKHHSGFCMWDTQTTDFNIMNTPYGKDIVRQFVDACRKYNLKVGFYYSPEDFAFHYRHGVPARGARDAARIRPDLIAYTKKHLDELLHNYGDIDLIFLDGGHKAELTQYVHQIAPNCLVTRGEMVTPEQKLPKNPIPGPWETCFTLGNQWQYKPTNEDYKSGTQLINMLIETRAKGGNLLINMGPMPSGLIPPQQQAVFRELALWMFVNDQAIYNIRPCPTAGTPDTYYTQSKDGKFVYAFLTGLTGSSSRGSASWGCFSRKTILLKELRAAADTHITVLGQDDRTELYNARSRFDTRFTQKPDGLEVSVVRAQRLYNNRRWPNAVVLRLENVEFVKNAPQ